MQSINTKGYPESESNTNALPLRRDTEDNRPRRCNSLDGRAAAGATTRGHRLFLLLIRTGAPIAHSHIRLEARPLSWPTGGSGRCNLVEAIVDVDGSGDIGDGVQTDVTVMLWVAGKAKPG